ncbi:MAG: OpgC domain-containing protein [Proteobacteria bacterium]|nr:OpgC domain-containing protein [Pseudomonadota bacterium]
MHERDLRIDFLRGLALLMIFIDHAPWNVLTLFTIHTWSFGDAAELFFFMSGYIAAVVYGRTLDKRGFAAAMTRIYRRGRDLYVTQIALLITLAIGLYAYTVLSEDTSVAEGFRLTPFLADPWKMTLHTIQLRYQPAYLDILPNYVLFFLALPFVLWLMRKNVWATLALSFALYLAVQFTGWTLYTSPDHASWFFDPFAWQFLFTLGVAFGSGRLSGLLPLLRSRAMLAAAALIAGSIALTTATAVWHGILPQIPSLHLLDVDNAKDILRAPRIVSFLALALLAWRFMPESEALAGFSLSRAIIKCGQQSLSIFSAGVLLDALASIVYGDWNSQAAVALATAGGVAILMAIAALLDRSQNSGSVLNRLQSAGAT